MVVFYFMFQAVFILLSTFLCFLAIKKGINKKKALVSQVLSVFVFGVVMFFSCANDISAESSVYRSSNVAEPSSVVGDISKAYGLGLIAAAIAIGVSSLGCGIAVASAAPAAIAAISENPDNAGKSLIFVAFAEGVAIYGTFVAIIILNKLDSLTALIK
ncbi:MAG: ATP synthase subunit C [Candidatus Paraimprobicoccus trichonymphae]|uniref:ATP synthase F(0) sector subunit c n=1 Tax=Candidatus Paraimprobicoccus trichonymphae TaxID=3033793 RepID=A0AA48KZ69_9FIRM|nr:MAG: ATP synthase subunit C [Candidatus Paraimprobicoccus trichonymphae]